jgi:hypothetical protein
MLLCFNYSNESSKITVQVAKVRSENKAKCRIVCSNLPFVFEYRLLIGYKNIFKNYKFVIRINMDMVISKFAMRIDKDIRIDM